MRPCLVWSLILALSSSLALGRSPMCDGWGCRAATLPQAIHGGLARCCCLSYAQVLSVLLLLLAVMLVRKLQGSAQVAANAAGLSAPAAAAAAAAAAVAAGAAAKQGGKPSSSGAAAAAAAAVAGAAAGSAAVVAGGGQGGGSWGLRPVQPPPVMWDPSYAVPEDVQQATSVPTDPYTSLKQNYEAVISFLTLVGC